MIKDNTKDNTILNFFNNKVSNQWNVLPENVIDSKPVNTFKAKIDDIYVNNKTYKTLKRQIVKEVIFLPERTHNLINHTTTTKQNCIETEFNLIKNTLELN